MMRWVGLLFPVLASAAALHVDPATKFDEAVQPGATITLKTDLAVDSPVTVHLLSLGGKDDVNRSDVPVKAPSGDAKGTYSNEIAYQLPNNLGPGGRYYLTLSFKDPGAGGAATAELIPGELRINPGEVKVDYAHPATAYRDKESGGYDFDVIGDGFSTEPSNDHVLVEGQGDIIAFYGTRDTCLGKIRAADADAAAKGNVQALKNRACLWVENAQKMHVVGYPGESYQGPLSLSVRVGNTVSTTKQSLILARMSPSGVLIAAVAIFVLMCFLIYRLVSSGVDEHLIDGKKLSPWAAFFLDRETSSYSLSKFQLFAFAFVFIFGYLYVFFCRWLVQWVFQLPDIPGNLSAMLGVSAGTTVLAAGATSARGNKGAGDLRPAFADFVSTGGLVVPERFQFFVWTVVACFGFVALLVTQNPATITAFPTFPDGLLYVMGVSSAGYLGGKLVRKPGPILQNIAVDMDPPPPASSGQQPQTPQTPQPDLPVNPMLILLGSNLSSKANYYIDGQELPLLTDAQKKDANGQPEKMVEPTPESNAQDPTFCSQLKIRINQGVAGVDLSKGEHVLRIMNPDAQYAEIRFTHDQPEITAVSELKASTAEVPLTVTGKNFQAGMTARWTKPGVSDPTDITADKVVYHSDTEVVISLVPGQAGTGSLLIRTPNGFSAMKAIDVKN